MPRIYKTKIQGEDYEFRPGVGGSLMRLAGAPVAKTPVPPKIMEGRVGLAKSIASPELNMLTPASNPLIRKKRTSGIITAPVGSSRG